MSVNLLLTLWPPSQENWDSIENEVQSRFPIQSRKSYRYSGDNWVNFIIELYKLCYEEYEHNRHPNIEKMIPKANFMSSFSKDIRLLEIKIENPVFQQYKNKNPYGIKEVKQMKDQIRLAFPNIPRFSVIHSFDTPVRNLDIINHMEDNCEKI